MGMAAYRIHDFQTAIYYIDATLSEDNRNFPDDQNTPPHLFLRLEGEDGRQAAQHIVQGVQQTIEEYIGLYNQVLDKNPIGIQKYSIDDLRKSFLIPSTLSGEPAKRSLSTSLITFFLEFKYRDFQLSLIRVPGTNEPFYMHLFKGCLIFESLLKTNPKTAITGRTLSKVLLELRDDLLLDPQSKLDISADDAEEALNLAIAGSDELTSSIIVTGKLRNTLSHNLGWPSEITRQQYMHGFLQVAISCIHVLAALYR
jgi:hypothetical protein